MRPKRVIDSLKLITFDATGTLLQFRKPPVQIYMDIALKNGIITDEGAMKSAFRKQWKSLNASQPHFGVCWKSWWMEFVVGTYKGSGVTNVDETILNSIASQLIEHFKTTDGWKVKPGTVDLLSQLSQIEALNIGVISNFDPRLREILKAVGISEYIEFCVLSHEERISKPSKGIFLKAIEISKQLSKNKFSDLTDILPDECLHIGDNYEYDYEGAVSMGWKAALLVTDPNPGDVTTGLPENSVFSSLPKFQQYLFS